MTTGRPLPAGLRRGLVVALGSVVLVLALLVPGLVNRDPLLFPDSIGYYHAGEAALAEIGWVRPASLQTGAAAPMPTMADRATDTVSTSRSVYYGILFVLLYAALGTWGLPIVQAAVVVAALWFALRRLAAPPPVAAAVTIAALALVAGLGVFTATIMPDVFGGLTILALALLLVPGRGGAGERLFWLGLLLVAALFHKANLALAGAIIGVYAVWLVVRRGGLRVLVAPLAVLAVAFAGHAAVGIVVGRLTHQGPVEIPFLLARAVGDHTVDPYLRAHCPGAGFAMCRYVDRLPMTTDEFLWSIDPAHGVLKLATPAERATIVQQANAVVLGSIRERPLAQLRASAGNFADQLVNVGATQFDFGPVSGPDATPGLRPLLLDYRHSRVAQRTMPLAALSAVMRITYLGAAAVLLVAALAARGAARPAAPGCSTVIVLLVGGVVINAAISGIIAGSYDRYQGRVAWIVVLAAICAVSEVRERRRTSG